MWWGGGGLPLNIIWRLRYFQKELKHFRDGLGFSNGLRNFRG